MTHIGPLLPTSRASVARMVAAARDFSEDLPAPVFEMALLLADDIEGLTAKVAMIDTSLKKVAHPHPLM